MPDNLNGITEVNTGAADSGANSNQEIATPSTSLPYNEETTPQASEPNRGLPLDMDFADETLGERSNTQPIENLQQPAPVAQPQPQQQPAAPQEPTVAEIFKLKEAAEQARQAQEAQIRAQQIAQDPEAAKNALEVGRNQVATLAKAIQQNYPLPEKIYNEDGQLDATALHQYLANLSAANSYALYQAALKDSQAMIQQHQKAVPQVVDSRLKDVNEEKALMNEFLGEYPQLKGHETLVKGIAESLIRQSNWHNVPKSDFLKQVAKATAGALNISLNSKGRSSGAFGEKTGSPNSNRESDNTAQLTGDLVQDILNPKSVTAVKKALKNGDYSHWEKQVNRSERSN